MEKICKSSFDELNLEFNPIHQTYFLYRKIIIMINTMIIITIGKRTTVIVIGLYCEPSSWLFPLHFIGAHKVRYIYSTNHNQSLSILYKLLINSESSAGKHRKIVFYPSQLYNRQITWHWMKLRWILLLRQSGLLPDTPLNISLYLSRQVED